MAGYRLNWEKGKSKYKYVLKFRDTQMTIRWSCNLPKYKHTFDTEREAAIAVDKELIKRGKEPVNILKRA